MVLYKTSSSVKQFLPETGVEWGLEQSLVTGYHGRMTYSLEVYEGGTLRFFSNGKWLHPLFDLERYLGESSLEPDRLSLKDTVIGRAAAMLIIRMGIRNVYGKVMSRLATDTFVSHGIEPGYGELVERIDCMTEELLANETNIESAYLMLSERAKKASGRR